MTSFHLALISSPEGVPDWADPSEFVDVELDRWHQCLAVCCDGKNTYHWDGGEPEDNLFLRDWSWVAPTIDKAYQHGVKDGAAEAVRKVVAFIRAECDKFEAAFAAETDSRYAEERLLAKASVLRTLAAYIERGDHDMPAARGE